MTPDIKSLILELHALGAIQFGSFTLKSGAESPIYIDLRLMISYPALMKKLSVAVNKMISTLHFDILCGVPYAALPFATAVSLEGNHPMIMCRKEAKGHGTKKLIEGRFSKGQTCLLIEDVITSGASILETTAALQNEGLGITDAVVLLDREQGGKLRLKQGGIQLHALISVLDLLKVLFFEKKITEEIFQKTNAFLASV